MTFSSMILCFWVVLFCHFILGLDILDFLFFDIKNRIKCGIIINSDMMDKTMQLCILTNTRIWYIYPCPLDLDS